MAANRGQYLPALSLLLLAATAVAGGNTASVTEEFIGPFPPLDKKPTVLVQRAGQELAFVLSDGKKASLVHSRQGFGPDVDLVPDGGVAFSKDGHVAYVAKVRGKPTLFVDHKVYAEAHEPVPTAPEFDSGGQRVAFIAAKGNKEYVVGGTEAGPGFDEIASGSLSFSTSDRRFAYRARNGKQWFAVVDGVPGTGYSEISAGPFFTADDSHHVYVGKRGEKAVVVVDGVEGLPWKEVQWLRLSPKGGRVVYVGVKGKAQTLVTDGTPGPEYEGIAGLVFSADASTLAYFAFRKGKWVLVMNGREGPEHAGVAGCALSADGRRNAYCTETKKRWRVVVDGSVSEEYDYVHARTPVFSADGARWAYVCGRKGKYNLVVDGHPGRAYDDIDIGGEDLVFSPDGRHTAYRAVVKGSGAIAVLDEQPGLAYNWIANGAPKFDEDGSIRYLAVRNDSLFRVHQPLHD